MTSKRYAQELTELEAGLKSIDKSILNPRNAISHRRYTQAKEIQQARIQFFKRGYNLHKREVEPQKTLSGGEI